MDDRDAIRAALARSKRCLRCIAAASGVSARRVADELRTVSEGAEVLTYEGHCRDCDEYRCPVHGGDAKLAEFFIAIRK